MKSVTMLIFFFIFLLVFGCSTKVQTRYNIKLPDSKQKSSMIASDTNTIIVIDQTTPKENLNPPNILHNPQFDTTVIDLSENLDIEISRANELFENKDYISALKIFISYVNHNTSNKSFSYWFARYKIAECLFELDQNKQALHELDEIKQEKEVSPQIFGNILLLQYKIFCKLNQTKDVEKIMLEIKQLFKDNIPKEIPPCNSTKM